jgi:F-type H+-transporting ATPase subunit b
MMHLFFAAEAAAGEAHSTGLLQALGIDGKLLIQQAVAFLILVAILRKFVYPVLIKSIDDRRNAIEAGLEEAKKAQQLLEDTEKKVAGMLRDARGDADEMLKRAQTEAAGIVGDAEGKAKQRAEQIVKDAHNQLEADVAKARQALKRDTIQLVALATERIIHEKVDARKDTELIDRALEDSTKAAGAKEARA